MSPVNIKVDMLIALLKLCVKNDNDEQLTDDDLIKLDELIEFFEQEKKTPVVDSESGEPEVVLAFSIVYNGRFLNFVADVNVDPIEDPL